MNTGKLKLEVGAISETGYVRKENQDRMSWSSVPRGQLYIVADGMGGHVGGAQAAELTVQGLEQHLSETSDDVSIEDAIREAFGKTNKNVYEKAHAGDPKTEGMGSTAVILLIIKRIAKIAHVGDSRAYLYRHGKLRLLTKDHTQVQRMVDAGMLTEEQARDHPSASVLDRAIGHRPTVMLDIEPDLLLNDGDGILLCSDGLTGYADDQEIESVMDSSLTLQENVERLFNLALQKGGEDNITIQFIGYKKKTGSHSKKFNGIFKTIMIAVLFFGIIYAASDRSYNSAKKAENEKITQLTTEHNKEIAERDLQIQDFANKISELIKDIKVRDNEINRIEVTKNRSVNETFRLKKQLESENQVNSKLKEDVERLEKEKKSTENQNNILETTIKNQKGKISSLQNEIASLKKLQEQKKPQAPKSAYPKEE